MSVPAHGAPAPRPLETYTWDTVPAGTVLVPVGSLEQHGPHLPLHADTVVARRVAQSAARELFTGGPSGAEQVFVGPEVPYGASGEHEQFPGTVSIGTPALTAVLTELGRSTLRWAHRLCFVNGHGGNVDALRVSVSRLRGEGHDVAWLSCGTRGAAGDLHAGRAETSLLSVLAPDLVRHEAISPGLVQPAATLIPELRDRGVRALSPTGVLGDPRGASADEGIELFAELVGRAVEQIRAWAPRDADGMLELPGE